MQISHNKVVTLTYKLSDHTTGEHIEETTPENALTFLYGVGGMIPEFEEIALNEFRSGIRSGLRILECFCTLADRHALLGPSQANFARQCLEAAGIPLTLTVQEACGMKREGVDEP